MGQAVLLPEAVTAPNSLICQHDRFPTLEPHLHFQSRKFRPSPRQMWVCLLGIMKRFLAVLLIVTGTIVSATSAYADNTKISPELRNLPSNQPAQVIVQYAPGTQLTCTGLLGLLDCVLNDVVQLGGTILGQLPLVNGLVAQLDGNGIVSLEPVKCCLHQLRPPIGAFGHQC